MDKSVIQFLDSTGVPLGTWIAIIIGVISFISGIVIGIKKIKKKYDDKLKKKLKKAEDDKKFRDSVRDIASTVSDIQNNMSDISNRQKEVTEKLNEVWTQLTESKADSIAGDNELKEQLKNYEEKMDNINRKLSTMDEKSTLLIESDKEGIKSYITDKYYQALSDGYVELHVLQTLEVRYEKYLQENGNTYVGKLMAGLRKMPNEKDQKTKNN